MTSREGENDIDFTPEFSLNKKTRAVVAWLGLEGLLNTPRNLFG